MTSNLPTCPTFVPPLKQHSGGVDFLGLRQVNLDLRDHCLPGFNNRTHWIRPFSLVSWIYWKFYQLCKAAGIEEPTDVDLRRFMQKTETLFTWGHKLHSVGDLPGIDADPPKKGEGTVSLRFEEWGRNATNTSLMAAVNYGPAMKTHGGLNFIDPVESSSGKFFKVVGNGKALAVALDALLESGLQPNSPLASLKGHTGNKNDALSLYPLWTILKPSKEERIAFRNSFFDANRVGGKDGLAKRSTTLALIISLLEQSDRPLSVEEIRKVLIYCKVPGTKRVRLTPSLSAARYRWLVFQIRQAQRLAFEALLAWIEQQVLWEGEKDITKIVSKAVSLLTERAIGGKASAVERIMNSLWKGLDGVEDVLAKGFVDDEFCLIELATKLENEIKNKESAIVPLSIRMLLLSAHMAAQLREVSDVGPMLEHGGPDRISLGYWNDTVSNRCAKMPFGEFMMFVLENLVLSQHLSVATRRYDGGTQRLRLALEEEGLVALTNLPWKPRATPDKLHSALSLMSECALVKSPKPGLYSA